MGFGTVRIPGRLPELLELEGGGEPGGIECIRWQASWDASERRGEWGVL